MSLAASIKCHYSSENSRAAPLYCRDLCSRAVVWSYFTKCILRWKNPQRERVNTIIDTFCVSPVSAYWQRPRQSLVRKVAYFSCLAACFMHYQVLVIEWNFLFRASAPVGQVTFIHRRKCAFAFPISFLTQCRFLFRFVLPCQRKALSAFSKDACWCSLVPLVFWIIDTMCQWRGVLTA